jgi:hypothetical protein
VQIQLCQKSAFAGDLQTCMALNVASSAIREEFGRFRGHRNFLRRDCPHDKDESDDAPWLLQYTASFTSNMTDDDILLIIQTLALKAMSSVVTRDMLEVDNAVIMFSATYTSRAGDKRELWQIPEAGVLAGRVLNLGWDGLWELPSTWGVKTVWYLVSDNGVRFTDTWRQSFACQANISHYIRDQVAPCDHNTIPTNPGHGSGLKIFKSLYPETWERL